MDSLPPPKTVTHRKLRPWYLVPALVLSWCLGVQRLTAGFANVAFLRDAILPDLPAAARNARDAGDLADFATLGRAVELDAMHRFARVTFPLNVAQGLLGALLVIASGLAMSGRRGARVFALQALAANALLTALAYALTPGVRQAFIEAMTAAAIALPAMPQLTLFTRPNFLWWLMRTQLIVGGLGSLGVVILALTRSRAKLYFEAAARASERADDDEP